MSTKLKSTAGDKFARYLQPATARERAARARVQASADPTPGRCYGYCRVSTVMQVEDGVSLDVQERQIAGYAQMHGFTVDRVFIERGVSGSKPLAARLQGGELLAILQPGDPRSWTACSAVLRTRSTCSKS